MSDWKIWAGEGEERSPVDPSRELMIEFCDDKNSILGALELLAESEGDAALAQQRVAELVSELDKFIGFNSESFFADSPEARMRRLKIEQLLAWCDRPRQVYDLAFSLFYQQRKMHGNSTKAMLLCALYLLDRADADQARLNGAPTFPVARKEFFDRYGMTDTDPFAGFVLKTPFSIRRAPNE